MKELQKKWGVEAENKKRTRALSAESLKYTMSVPPEERLDIFLV